VTVADGAVDPETGLAAFRGHAVCLDAATDLEAPCTPESTRFALRTEDGRRIAVDPDDLRAGPFADPRVRARPLEVRGWLRESGTLEVLRVYTLHGGTLHHVHYRCDICDIDASGPGPCWCCGRDFELREDPGHPAEEPQP